MNERELQSEIERLKREHPLAWRIGVALTYPARLVHWLLFGNFHRLVNWWWFWPFCLIGLHSKKPSVIFGPNTIDTPRLVCRACSQRVARYGAFISWDDCKRRGIIE